MDTPHSRFRSCSLPILRLRNCGRITSKPVLQPDREFAHRTTLVKPVHAQITDRRVDVAECAAAFDVLQAIALSPEASLDFLARIRKES